MEEQQIENLLEELKTLKIRESVIITRLEAANRQRLNKNTRNPKRETSNDNTSGIVKGDRVWITSKVRKPATWPRGSIWIESEFRSATVNSVTATQVHLVTDNGITTWRAPNNVKRVTST
jgi:hypothetical protein